MNLNWYIAWKFWFKSLSLFMFLLGLIKILPLFPNFCKKVSFFFTFEKFFFFLQLSKERNFAILLWVEKRFFLMFKKKKFPLQTKGFNFNLGPYAEDEVGEGDSKTDMERSQKEWDKHLKLSVFIESISKSNICSKHFLFSQFLFISFNIF